MNSFENFNILISLFTKRPLSLLFEGFLESIKPYIKRVVTVILFIGAFREYVSIMKSKGSDVVPEYSFFFDMVQPVALTAIVFLVVPGILEQLSKYAASRIPLRSFKLNIPNNELKTVTKIYKKRQHVFGYFIIAPLVYICLYFLSHQAAISLAVTSFLFWTTFFVLDYFHCLKFTKKFSYSLTSLFFVTYVLLACFFIFFQDFNDFSLVYIFCIIMIPKIHINQLSNCIFCVFKNDELEEIQFD